MSRGLVCEFIAAEKTVYGVRRLCRVLGISPASFYAWAEHRRIYGARRLTAEVRDRGHAWNRKRVARLMRLGAIEGIHRRRRGRPRRRSWWG